MKINGWVIGGAVAVAVAVAAFVLLKPKTAGQVATAPAPVAKPPKPDGTAATIAAIGGLVSAGLSVFNAGDTNGWW